MKTPAFHGPTLRFNPWHGCTRVSPGCENCYAETFSKRLGRDIWGPGKPRRLMSEHYWNEPLRWNRKAEKAGKETKVFCASMADIFDADAPDGQRERLWELIRKTPNLIWQLLTKRPEGYSSLLPYDILNLDNVWKGATTEDQEWYEKRHPFMEDLPGIWWASYEPALGPITHLGKNPPAWLVFGGESGNRFRHVGKQWAVDVMNLCDEAGTKFFMKQWSARTPAQGKLLIPEFLRIHEFPDAPQSSQNIAH